jgi:DNA-binding transcriptional regulator LsrR (DeoR family)
MRESIFLNKNEMISFYWVDVEIGRGAGDFLYSVYESESPSVVIGVGAGAESSELIRKDASDSSEDVRCSNIVGGSAGTTIDKDGCFAARGMRLMSGIGEYKPNEMRRRAEDS